MTEKRERGFFGWTLILAQGVLVVILLLFLIPFVLRSLREFPTDTNERIRLARKQAISIRDSLRNERGILRMQEYFPEGGCFMVTLYGLVWSNVMERSEDATVRNLGLDELRWVLGEFEKLYVTAPFTDAQVRRGVFWLGQRNLVLARYLALVPEASREAKWENEFHRNSAELHAAFMASPTHHLDSYTGLAWSADNLTALLSLTLHDRLYQTAYRDAYDAWKSWTLEHLDETTGLPAASLDRVTGSLKETARGSSCAWMLTLLRELDPELATDFYQRFAEHFKIDRMGFSMFREFPASSPGAADADSGPIVLDAGATATGIGLAAALANGDLGTAVDVHSLAEMWAVPRETTFDGRNGRRLFFGRLPLASGFLAWAYSNPNPLLTPADTSPDARELLRLRPVFYTTAFVASILLGLYGVMLLRACRRRGP